MNTRFFRQAKEKEPNPYIGFTSFQHFNGERLYSDPIVRPENHMCETENLECWPIPEDVPQNGREEGFYPEADIAYFRVLWKEFEPERGQYRYELIEELLRETRAHRQRLLFRLIPHSTRASDDVPEWLKKLIPCPERPAGKRVKDSPTDPRFLILFGEAIRKLGERFDKDPVFYAMDICLPGAWGEGYRLENYPDDDLKRFVDVFAESFPHTRLTAQIGLPWLVNGLNRLRPVGWRGDGCGEPHHILERYPALIAQLTPDLWKRAPVSFESYWWLGEWKRQGWDPEEIIRKTLEWHVSCFNAKSVPIPREWKGLIDGWLDRMGYHLYLSRFTAPAKARAGERVSMSLTMNNTGVAPLYEEVPVLLRLRGEGGQAVLDTGLKPVEWLPGETESTFAVKLPAGLRPGVYRLDLGMETPEGKPVYLRTDAPCDAPFYEAGELRIE